MRGETYRNPRACICCIGSLCTGGMDCCQMLSSVNCGHSPLHFLWKGELHHVAYLPMVNTGPRSLISESVISPIRIRDSILARWGSPFCRTSSCSLTWRWNSDASVMRSFKLGVCVLETLKSLWRRAFVFHQWLLPFIFNWDRECWLKCCSRYVSGRFSCWGCSTVWLAFLDLVLQISKLVFLSGIWHELYVFFPYLLLQTGICRKALFVVQVDLTAQL